MKIDWCPRILVKPQNVVSKHREREGVVLITRTLEMHKYNVTYLLNFYTNCIHRLVHVCDTCIYQTDTNKKLLQIEKQRMEVLNTFTYFSSNI